MRLPTEDELNEDFDGPAVPPRTRTFARIVMALCGLFVLSLGALMLVACILGLVNGRGDPALLVVLLLFIVLPFLAAGTGLVVTAVRKPRPPQRRSRLFRGPVSTSALVVLFVLMLCGIVSAGVAGDLVRLVILIVLASPALFLVARELWRRARGADEPPSRNDKQR